jgi:hypothetical protein
MVTMPGKTNVQKTKKPGMSVVELMIVVTLLTFLNVFFVGVISNVNDAILRESFENKKDELDLVVNIIDHHILISGSYYINGANNELLLDELLFDIQELGNIGNETPYAAIFNSQMELVTRDEHHWFGDSDVFDPLRFPEFIEAVKNSDRGELTLWCEHDGSRRHDVFIYFRTVPSSDDFEQFTAVVGMSRYSVRNQIPPWVNYALTLVLIATMINNIVCFIRTRWVRSLNEEVRK